MKSYSNLMDEFSLYVARLKFGNHKFCALISLPLILFRYTYEGYHEAYGTLSDQGR